MMQHSNGLTRRVLPAAVTALLVGGTIVCTQAVAAPSSGSYMSRAQAGQQSTSTATASATAVQTKSGASKESAKKKPDQLATVVVTGIRASLESAEARKRDAPQIMESIVAQDIGKLPDTNAADALQRITGVQAVRDEGEGSTITIRGLTQIQTELNGNTVFTASGDRTLNFEDIPAGLLAGADVYKTPAAWQTEGGIGGIINLRTHRPFDFGGFKATTSVGGTYASIASKVKPRVTGLISNTWHTSAGKFGALLAISYQDRPYAQNYTELNPTDTSTGVFDVNGDGTIDANDVLVYPPGIYYEYSHGHRRRIGVNTSLQWQATDDWQFYLDAYYASFKSIGNYNSVYVDSSAGSALNISNLYAGTATIDAFTMFPGTHDMATGTFSGATATPQSFNEDFQDKTYNFSLGSKWIADPFTLDANIHYAQGTHEAPFNELDLHAIIPKFSMDMRPSEPVLNYHGFDLSNPGNFTYADVYWSNNHNTGKLTSVKLDATYTTGSEFFNTLKFGYRYAKRTATNEANSLFIDHSVTGPDLFGQPVSSIPGLVANRKTAIGYAATPDAHQLRDVAAIFRKFNLGPVPGGDPLQAFNFGEKTNAVYLAALFNSYGPIPISGDIGVRAVRTNDAEDGVLSTGTTVSPLHKTNSYTDILPSLNLTAHLTERLQWRFAASRTMARPNFSQLTPSVFLNALQHTGSSGNPDLKPIDATGYDTSLGWFFSKGSYVFGDVFYKKINNSIANAESVQTFGGETYRISRPTNANSGKLKGIELGYQQFFTWLPGWLSGLGLKANYTYIDSSVNGIVPGFQTSLPLLSKNSYNLMLLYDYHKLWWRVAYNWRSSYFDRTRASALGSVPIYQKGYGILDASIGYHINGHLDVSVDAVNLAKAQRNSYYLRPTLPNEWYETDRRIVASVRFTF